MLEDNDGGLPYLDSTDVTTIPAQTTESRQDLLWPMVSKVSAYHDRKAQFTSWCARKQRKQMRQKGRGRIDPKDPPTGAYLLSKASPPKDARTSKNNTVGEDQAKAGAWGRYISDRNLNLVVYLKELRPCVDNSIYKA